MTTTTGEPRHSAPDMPVPFVTRVGDLVLDPVPIVGLVCLCLRDMEEPAFGVGNGGAGEIACGLNGLDGVDVSTVADSGMVTTTLSGHGISGSAILRQRLALSILSDAGRCSDAPDCRYPDYGADCLPCTDDDAVSPIAMSVVLTTSIARAEVRNANGVAGATIGPDSECFGAPCVARAVGGRFDCAGFSAPGPLVAGTLAAAIPILDMPSVGDAVLTMQLANRVLTVPTPSVQPTPTATADRPDAPNTLLLRRASIRADIGSRAGARLSVRARLDDRAPFDGLIADVRNDGIVLDVTDGSGATVSLPWQADDCAVSSGSRQRARCTARDDLGGRVLTIRPVGNGESFELSAAATGLAIASPLTGGPVRASVTTRRYRRSDDLAACTVHGAVLQLEHCRER